MAKEKSDGVHLIRSAQTLARIVARFEKESIELYNQEKRIKNEFRAKVEQLNKEIQKLPEYIEVTRTQSLLSQLKFELTAVTQAKSAPEKYGLEYSSGKILESSDYDQFQTETQKAVERLEERLLTQQAALKENEAYKTLTNQLQEISKKMDSHPDVIRINKEIISARDEISKTLEVLYKLIEAYPQEKDRIMKEYESTLQQFSDSEKSFSSSSSSSDSSSSLSSSYSSSSSSFSDSIASEMRSFSSSESPISLLLNSSSKGSATSEEVSPAGEVDHAESDS